MTEPVAPHDGHRASGDDQDQPQPLKTDPASQGISGLTQPTEPAASGNKEAPNNQTKYPILYNFSVIANILFSGLLVLVGSLQYCVYSQQADIMKVDQRAWLYPSKIQFTDDLLITEKEAIVYMDITIKNSGRLPAVGYKLPIVLQVFEDGDREIMFSDERRIPLCRNQKYFFNSLGTVIFPGQEATEHIPRAYPGEHQRTLRRRRADYSQ